MKVNGVCRCCLNEGLHKDLKASYMFFDRKEVYSDMLLDCFNIVLPSDSLSNAICNACISSLRNCYNFKHQVLKCQAQLMLKGSIQVDSADDMKKVEVTSESKQDNDDDSDDYFLPLPADDVKEVEVTLESKQDNDDDSDDYFLPLPDDAKEVPVKLNPKWVSDDSSDYSLSDADEYKLEPFIKETAQLVHTPFGPRVEIIRHTKPNKPKEKTKHKYKLEPFIKETAQLVHTPSGPRVEIIRHTKPEKPKEKTKHVNKAKLEQDKLRANMASLLKHSTIIPFKSKYINMGTPYLCIYCRKLHKKFSELRQHIEGCHNDITAPTIDNCLRSVQGLMLCADVSLIKCKQCDLVVKTIEALMEHLTVHGVFQVSDDRTLHQSVNSHIIGFDMSADVLKCNTCGKQSMNFRALLSHMSEHYGTFVCHICGKKLIYKSSLQAHLTHHLSSDIKCKHCGQIYKTLCSLHYHIQKDHLKRTVKCPECPETFPITNTNARTVHMDKVHGVKTIFKCDVCDKEYSHLGGLKSHKRYTHSRKKEYKCDLCHYGTFRGTVMKAHLNAHYAIKNYECQFCFKKFAKQYTLKCHVKKHLDDKKHLCSLCGETFLKKGNFKSHVKSRHPDSGFDFNKL